MSSNTPDPNRDPSDPPITRLTVVNSPVLLDNSLDNPMDYHNNAIGRNYWINHVTESGILWWYKINIPSDDAIIASIYSRAENAVYCTTTVQITNAVNDLVYIPFNVAYPAP